jgi:hypothetical protein
MKQKAIFEKRPKFESTKEICVEKAACRKAAERFLLRKDGKELFGFCSVSGFKPSIQ